jgi:transposase
MLCSETIEGILTAHHAGESNRFIALQFGVSSTTVHRVANGWRPKVWQPRQFRATLMATAHSEDRFRTRVAAEAAAVALYNDLSIRDIARELDTTAAFVQTAAAKAGLPPRPVADTPGRSSSAQCRTNNGSAFRKLTAAQVVDLRESYAAGIPTKALAERYRVAQRTVCTIAFGGTYKWVPGALPPEMKRQGRRG